MRTQHAHLSSTFAYLEAPVPMFACEWLRRIALALPLVGFVPLASCGPPGICDGFDPMERTEHFVISEVRAGELAVNADLGYGRTCRDECGSRVTPGTPLSLRTCSVGGPTDGGVALSCTFANVCW